ncbi:MAG: HD-GYP domain-containing protein [Clostridia bacterium]|nr:HD-GYP domain-containing protein [Clostridia bacterium]
MKKKSGRKIALILFIVTLCSTLICFGASVLKMNAYNRKVHNDTFAGAELFSPEEGSEKDVTVAASARSSTWGKIFDFNNEGITENNYQAFTYDFAVTNNTKDEVSEFTYKLTFSEDVFLASAWNGALEIHQMTDDGEIVDTVPDLREFHPENHTLETVTVDGEPFVAMKAGDFLIYHPSSSANALEVPINPYEGTVPGIIMYVENGKSIEGSSIEIEYRFNRLLTSETLFWVAAAGLAVWLMALVNYEIIASRVKKYNERHERDNKIINESIETFIGFIDAKDPYTNGHSKRVALYTKMIAQELGYDGEDLDRIYYIALLHDSGKIGVPDNILGKPGKLTEDEFEIIKSHTVRGGEILDNFKSLDKAGEGALYHHERYDGKGYPEGKAGEAIPLIARMICVTDSFDAMNTDRVYRKKLSKEDIINELQTNKGTQFDPAIADIMLKLIEEGTIKA